MLREFIESPSGLAPMRQGLGLGSVVSMLAGVAVLFGAKGAAAHPCSSSTWTEECVSCTYKQWNGSTYVDANGYQDCTYSYKHQAFPGLPHGTCELVSDCTSCSAPAPPCP